MELTDEVLVPLRKIVERIMAADAANREYLVHLVNRAANLEGIGSVFQRILQRDDQAMIDHLMEIKYGVLFDNARSHVRFEPTGDRVRTCESNGTALRLLSRLSDIDPGGPTKYPRRA